jgi:1-acyl-sn-glycerol-3-phosphate acyltransferase
MEELLPYMERFLNWAGTKIVGLLSHLMFTMDVVEQEKLPPGPKIFAANHPSTTDPFVVLGYSRRKSRVMIKDVLFDVPVFGPYLNAAGHISVQASNGRAAFERALNTLERGENVIIFPEGHVSPLGGGFWKARTGVARLALETGAPVIPLGIHLDHSRIRLVTSKVKGADEVGTWYLSGPYAITAGRAIHLDGSVDDREQVMHSAERIMAHIVDLAHESRRRLEARRMIPASAPTF